MVLVFVMAMETYIRMARQYEAETEMIMTMYTLKTAFSSSVNVEYGGPAVANSTYSNRAPTDPTDITRTTIFSINSNLFSTSYNNYMIALGVREFAIKKPAAATHLQSDFYSYGLFYIPPRVSYSGAIAVDQEKNASGGWTRVSPVNAMNMHTRLVDFRLNDIIVLQSDGQQVAVNTGGANVGLPVLGANVELYMRYFTKGKDSLFQWCPVASMASCSMDSHVKYYDFHKSMRVTFANNAFDRKKYLGPRPFGDVYLFKFAQGKAR